MKYWFHKKLAILAAFLAITPVVVSEFAHIALHRSPAGFDQDNSCYKLIKSFYSKERNALLNTRLESADDLHMFYRSFPPLYYKLMEEEKWKKRFSDISKFESVMAGDSHMDNYGLKYFNGSLRLSVNDYDDLTYGPIFLDLIRLLGSAHIMGIDQDKKLIEEVLSALSDGLKGKKHEYSKTLEEMMEESKKMEMLDPKSVDKNAKKFIKKKGPNSPLSKNQEEEWKKLVKGYGEIKDSYYFVKQFGGSGGLGRFEFVTEKDGQIFWIEAKEWSTPSYDSALKSNPPGDSQRYDWIMTYDRPVIKPSIVEYNGKTYYIRNIDERQIGIETARIKRSQRADVLIDEAYALGEFLRFYLENPKAFIKALDEIKTQDLMDFIQLMTKKIKKNQNSLK